VRCEHHGGGGGRRCPGRWNNEAGDVCRRRCAVYLTASNIANPTTVNTATQIVAVVTINKQASKTPAIALVVAG